MNVPAAPYLIFRKTCDPFTWIRVFKNGAHAAPSGSLAQAAQGNMLAHISLTFRAPIVPLDSLFSTKTSTTLPLRGCFSLVRRNRHYIILYCSHRSILLTRADFIGANAIIVLLSHKGKNLFCGRMWI